jgi:flagellum-specific ATP synthase
VRGLMATFREKEDLIAIGAYQAGTDPRTDAAIAAREPIEQCLRQTVQDVSSADQADAQLAQLALLHGTADPAAAVHAAMLAESGAPGAEGSTPLASAIPPLHLAA